MQKILIKYFAINMPLIKKRYHFLEKRENLYALGDIQKCLFRKKSVRRIERLIFGIIAKK